MLRKSILLLVCLLCCVIIVGCIQAQGQEEVIKLPKTHESVSELELVKGLGLLEVLENLGKNITEVDGLDSLVAEMAKLAMQEEEETKVQAVKKIKAVKKSTSEHVHSYVFSEISPTCTQKGYTSCSCECGHSYKKNIIEETGHDYKKSVVDSNYTDKGYDLYTCTICNDSYKDNYKDPVVTYTEVNETVYALSDVNIRKGASTDYEKIGSLNKGDSITRIGIGDNGWSKVMYNDTVAYIHSDYLTTEKPIDNATTGYPMTYSDATCTITIYKEWYNNAYVYAAHLEFSDYTRFGTECANGKFNSGTETTSHAAKRIGAIFAVNGCYSAKNLGYPVVRSGVVWNDKNCVAPGAYNSANGIFTVSGALGINNILASEAVAQGLITDTFRFGDVFLSNGKVSYWSSTERAQRTFIGTNGKSGDLWVCVSDGRYNDSKSAGLTYSECAEFLQSKGCIFGIPLDGGGSSTMYFNGKVLNAAKNNQRAVIDFVYFK